MTLLSSRNLRSKYPGSQERAATYSLLEIPGSVYAKATPDRQARDDSATMTQKKFRLYLCLITAAGIIPRVFLLRSRGSFWFDEVFSLKVAQLPFLQALSIAGADTFPPLHTLLMWPWIRIFGDTEIATRIPALILGISSIYLLGLLAKQWLGPRAGLLAATLLAVSRFGIYFSTEARQYALYLFLTLLTWYFFTKKNKRSYFISSFLLLASHTYAIFPLAFTYVWGIPEERKKRKPWHIKHGILTLIYTAWAAFALVPKLPDLFTNSWYLAISPPKGWPLAIFSNPLISSHDSWIFWITTALVILLILSTSLPAIAAKKRKESMLFAMMLCSVIIAWLAGPPKLKYFIFVIPLLFLLLAHAVEKTEKKWRGLYGGILLMLMMGSSYNLVSDFRFSWDLAADYVAEQNTSVLIPWSVNAIPFGHYNKGEFTTIPAPNTSTTTIKTITQTSWKWNLDEPYIQEQLEKKAPTSTELLVVQSDPYVQGVKQWLEAKDYQHSKTEYFDSLSSVAIEHYKKTDPKTESE